MRRALRAAALGVVLVAACRAPAPEPQAPGLPAPEPLATEPPASAPVFFRGDLERNAVFGRATLAALESQRALRPADPLLLGRLGAELLQVGELARAAEVLEEARRLESSPHLAWLLALVAFRRGELDNCVARHAPESCFYPLQGPAVHVDRGGALSARELLLELLAARPQGLEPWRARWLLNLAAMALGDWPGAVPEADRLPGDPFQQAPAPRFVNVAREAGLEGPMVSGGAVLLEDLDGDGDLDLLASGWLPDEPLRLYLNDGMGAFLAAPAPELLAQRGGVALAQADYDGDGALDVLVVRGAQPDPAENPAADDGRMARCSLLRNLGGGRFQDVTEAAGLDALAPWSSAAWADFDGDGWIDLYLAAQSDGVRGRDRLWRNRGDGTFDEVGRRLLLENGRHCMAAVWGDPDDDGDPDLFLSNYGGPNRLWENRGDRFVDRASDLGLGGDSLGQGAWFLDADGDGRLDLLLTSHGVDPGEAAAAQFGVRAGGPTPRLHLNRGPAGFEDATRAWGLDRPWASWSGNPGDLDGDGDQDFYLGTGGLGLEALFPNVLLSNTGSGFEDVAGEVGAAHLQKASAVAIGDVDGDGASDVVVRAGGCTPADGFGNVLLKSPGPAGRWLHLTLEGRRSNRAAIGARIAVTVADADGRQRTIRRWIGSGGGSGASTLRAELGLGNAVRIERLEVRWPGGEVETLPPPALDGRYRIVEGEGRLR